MATYKAGLFGTNPLVTKFEFDDKNKLSEELVRRLELFADERFINELRLFIHYFDMR